MYHIGFGVAPDWKEKAEAGVGEKEIERKREGGEGPKRRAWCGDCFLSCVSTPDSKISDSKNSMISHSPLLFLLSLFLVLLLPAGLYYVLYRSTQTTSKHAYMPKRDHCSHQQLRWLVCGGLARG